jgi:solute carrier family 35 protein F1/2
VLLALCYAICSPLRSLVARRSSKEPEETAQVVGASDEHGREGDEEAGMQNPVGSSVAAGNRDQISYKELPSAGSPSKN